MEVERVDYITIPTRDEERSRSLFSSSFGDTGVCKMAVCLDPDGNAVILHRRYEPYG